MVKIGPRLPRPSRREIDKMEREQRRVTQIENWEGTTEPCELLEPAMQRKRARHRDIDDADLEDSKRKREKTLKRREARRLAKQAERELARREGSPGCVEDSLEFLLAELDRHYNDHGHQPSQTPMMLSGPQQNEFNDAGDSSVLPSTDEPMEGVTTYLHSSPTTGSVIHPPLVSPSESMMAIDTIATPENPFEMQVTEPLEELHAATFTTAAAASPEEPEPILATSNNLQPPMPPYHSQNTVGAGDILTIRYQPQHDTINWLPMLQLPGSLSQSMSSVPVTMPEVSVASGTTRPTEALSSQLSHSSIDSSVNPSITSEPLSTSNFSSSGPSSATLNLQEILRVSLVGAVDILPNDSFGPNTLASLTSRASYSSTLPSVSGSSLTRESHMDSTTVPGPSISAVPTGLTVPGPSTTPASATESASLQLGGASASGSHTGLLGLGVVVAAEGDTSSAYTAESERLSIPVIPPCVPTAGSQFGANLARSSFQFSFATQIPDTSASSTRTRSTTLTLNPSRSAQGPLTAVFCRPRASSLPTANTSGVMRANEKLQTAIAVRSPVYLSEVALSPIQEVDDTALLAPEDSVQADPCWASIPEVNLLNDADFAVVGAAVTRRRVRSDTFSSNISDSANAATTALDGRVPTLDNDRGMDEVFHQKGFSPFIEGTNETDSESSTTLLAPAAQILDDLSRPPVLPPVPESDSGDLSELRRMTAMEVEPTQTVNIVQTETVTSIIYTPNTPFSEPIYPDTPQPRSGLIPPYSTPTSQSPRIFTLELPSPRKASKAAPILPIHNPNLSRPEEKRGSSIIYALKWMLKKTFEYFSRGAGR